MGFIFASPDEIARTQMLQEDWRNRMNHVIENLDAESLVIMRDMFDAASRDKRMASFYEGLFQGLLQSKFPHLCRSCGGDHLDHEASLATETTDTAPIKKAQEVSDLKINGEAVPGTVELKMDGISESLIAEIDGQGRFEFDVPIEPDGGTSLPGDTPKSSPLENFMSNMESYGVTPLIEGELSGEVICIRCGYYTWPSLADRMLRSPDEAGCPQCINKAKFG